MRCEVCSSCGCGLIPLAVVWRGQSSQAGVLLVILVGAFEAIVFRSMCLVGPGSPLAVAKPCMFVCSFANL